MTEKLEPIVFRGGPLDGKRSHVHLDIEGVRVPLAPDLSKPENWQIINGRRVPRFGEIEYLRTTEVMNGCTVFA